MKPLSHRCRAPRWQHLDPAGDVTAHTVGTQLLLDHTFKTSDKWLWGGIAFVFVAAIFFNLLVNLALALLSSALAEAIVMASDCVSTEQCASHERSTQISAIVRACDLSSDAPHICESSSSHRHTKHDER